MKKYCLTDCFKKKLSTGKRITIELLTGFSVAVIVIIGVLALFTIVGIATQFITQAAGSAVAIFAYNPVMLGILILTVLAITIAAVIIIYVASKFIIKILYVLIKAAITGKLAPSKGCQIFQECKEE